MDSSVELILIPSIGAGHLISAVEIAKLIVARDSRLSITVLLLKFPNQSGPSSTADSLSISSRLERIKFVDIQRDEPNTGETTPLELFSTFLDSQKPKVRDIVRKIISSGTARVGGFLLDMFCISMIDVADEFGVPYYILFTSGAGLLCLHHTFSDAERHHESGKVEDELAVAGFANPVPSMLFPFNPLDKVQSSLFCSLSRAIVKSKGVLVNTFEDLEPGMIKALVSLNRIGQFPWVYPVGPIINFGVSDRKAEIMEWLDGQLASSVVFLCFGSMGSLEGDQVREIAIALEKTGVRFLWSLRRPGKMDGVIILNPTEYENPSEVLPEGFLERTAGIGKVVGWAPQVAVLGHPAIGGFVSHCGWNSVLESVWFGVPLATWPLNAEQHLNAFELVREYGLAVEISMDKRIVFVADKTVDSGVLVVKAERIERGIEKLMESESEIRKRVKEMSKKSKIALLQNGSSYYSVSRFINEVITASDA